MDDLRPGLSGYDTTPLSPTDEWPTPKVRLSMKVVPGLVVLADCAVILLSGTLIYFSYVGATPTNWLVYGAAMAINTAVAVTTFHYMGAYRLDVVMHPLTRHTRLVFAYLAIFLVCMGMAFSLKISEEFSRVWAFSWFLLASVSLWSVRMWIGRLLSALGERGRFTRNVVIVGAGDHGARLIEELQRNRDPWIRIIGIFDDRRERSPERIGRIPVIGNLAELSEFVRRHVVDDVLVALPASAEQRLFEIFDALQIFPIDVSLSPDFIGYNFNGDAKRSLGGVSFLPISGTPISGWGSVAKSLEDQLLSLLFLLIWTPVMLAIAAAIKIDSPGPVLFRQMRRGFNGQEFNVLKFRTMVVDAGHDQSVPQATINDPRITRVGAVLRHWSLDELPQLVNVLRGEMSIVGPRPHAIVHDDQYSKVIDSYLGRHAVKPGMTGWAQVNGYRGETDTLEKMERRLEHDLFYIRQWSVLFDLWIIFRTPFAMVWGTNAY